MTCTSLNGGRMDNYLGQQAEFQFPQAGPSGNIRQLMSRNFLEEHIFARAALETPNWLKDKICTRYVGQLERMEQLDRGTEAGSCGSWISS